MSIFNVPAPSAELSERLDEAAHFFLDLRGVGHFLAPQDSRILVEWLDQGVPLRVVTQGLHEGWQRLQAEGRPVRSIRTVKKDVQKRVKRHWTLNAAEAQGAKARVEAPQEAGEGDAGRAAASAYVAAQIALLEEILADARADGLGDWIRICEACLDALRGLGHGPGALPEIGGLIPALLAIGRRFYDGLLLALTAEELGALRASAEGAMEGWIRPLSEDAREEAIQELMVSDLRGRLGLFNPTELFGLWGA